MSYSSPSFLSLRASPAVTITSGAYSATKITFPGPVSNAHSGLLGVTVMFEALVATAVAELWLCSIGSDPTLDASYFFSGQSTTTGATWPLASWPGAQIRFKSGGTAGTIIANATAD